jgi:hypothetical protein
MVAGEAGGDIEPEGGVMWTWTEIFGWAALLSLPAVMIGVELGAYLVRRRRRLDPWGLLGAEVRRLNAGRKTHT